MHAMDRRSLLDDEATPEERPREDVFGDDHEFLEEDFDFVADGFRPAEGHAQDTVAPKRHDTADSASVRTLSVHYAPGTHESSSVRPRDSIRKSRTARNPFANPGEDEDENGDHYQTLQFEPDAHDVRRSISSASSALYATTHTPRISMSAGPSHPYNMYPQGTLPRSSSTATSSAAGPTSRHAMPRTAPQHPYAMYPQGVDDHDEDEDEDDDLIQHNPVNVGFAGIGNTYRRRMGPDGEEQDIIGQDGHTEQLPPYSRFPDEGPEKPLLVPSMPSALHSRAPVHGSDPTMPLMHNVLQPTQTHQSMTDASALERPLSLSDQDLLESSSSEPLLHTDEKTFWKKSWKDKRKHRFCNIPLCWYLILLTVLLFIFGLIGGIAGGYLAGIRNSALAQSNNGLSVVTVVTSLYDATLIPTPTAAAPSTGTFALTLSTPQEVQSECLTNTAQQVAWSCNLSEIDTIAINVTVQNGSLGANLFYASDNQQIMFGAQTSSLNTSFAQFLTVQDKDAPQSGPAFYFAQTYNKVVVVPDEAFLPNQRRFRRDFNPDLVKRDVVTPGTYPWFCVWNNTLLEAFIYVEKPTITSTSSSSTITSPPSTAASSITTSTSPTSASNGSPFTYSDSTTVTYSLSTGLPAIYTGPVSGLAPWIASYKAQATGMGGPPHKRQATSVSPWNSMLPYPNIIKLEERRTPNNNDQAQPYCQQYQILWNGHANWRPDKNGAPIKVWLNEQDPAYSAYQNSAHVTKSRRNTFPAGGCHCQWVAGGTIGN